MQTQRAVEAAVVAGANALGFVSESVGPPAVLPDDEIAALTTRVPSGVLTVLLTALESVDAIVEARRRTGVRALQLVDRMSPDQRRVLRRRMPDVMLIQVVHVIDDDSVDEAREAQEHADVLLLDSGNLSGSQKQFGGTGRTHDWRVSARIRTAIRVPVALAGGLDAANVGDAIAAVRPAWVDVCSGVRRDGALDEERLSAFVAAARGRD